MALKNVLILILTLCPLNEDFLGWVQNSALELPLSTLCQVRTILGFSRLVAIYHHLLHHWKYCIFTSTYMAATTP